MPRVENLPGKPLLLIGCAFVDWLISKSGDDVRSGRLGWFADFATSFQVNLVACSWFKSAEASICAAKSYIGVLTDTGLEGW